MSVDSVVITTPPVGSEAPAPAYTGPEYIPEKFRTAEDPAKAMAEAYAELEKKLSAPKADEPKPGEKTPPAAKTPDEIAAEAAKKAEAAPPGMEGYFKEYAETGKLSDDSFAALEKMGLTKDVVEAYINGQEALAARQGAELMDSIGGEETYKAVVEWAGANIPEADQDAYNALLSKGDLDGAKTMAAKFKAQYDEANGTPAARSVEAKPGNSTAVGYRSRAEMTRDMADPRYAKDPAFRDDVVRRSLASTF